MGKKKSIHKSSFCIDNPLEEEKESTKSYGEGVEVRDEPATKKYRELLCSDSMRGVFGVTQVNFLFGSIVDSLWCLITFN